MRTPLKQFYNLRERLNIYTGVAGGLLAPVAFYRYISFPFESKNMGEEAMKWMFAGLCSLGHFKFNLLPLTLGFYTGFAGAEELRSKREYSQRISEKRRTGEAECPRFEEGLLDEYIQR
ncbi:MAG: hypothetical protein PHF67_00620 [Candidatus Nanoarchaeia archaeon]|nr:hypothetical protein [Candidatus Nanoarchaeia archaeon]